MIVQTMAMRAPERVLTMTSIMSYHGRARLRVGARGAGRAAWRRRPPTATGASRPAWTWAASSPAPATSTPTRRRATPPPTTTGRSTPRAPRARWPPSRHGPDRTEALRSLAVPTLVIHGRADTLILPSGGEATAAAIPGANLLMLNDMAHDLPEPLWPLTVDAIVSHTTHAIG